jgi:AraC-like DNA-binding protein
MIEAVPPVVISRVIGPESLVSGIRHANLEPVQLGAATGPGWLGRICCADVCLDLANLSAPMFFSGVMPRNGYSLMVVTRCPTPGRSFNFGVTHGDGYLGLFAPAAQVEATTPAGYGNASLTIPESLFLEGVARDCPELPATVLRGGAGVKIPESRYRVLLQLRTRVSDALRDPNQPLDHPAARCQLQSELLHAFLEVAFASCERRERPARGGLQRRHQHLARARGILEHCAAAHRPVELLCTEMGLGRRTVEYLFRDLLGVGPATYLKLLRLNAVRSALRAADPGSGTVKRTALEWGFWHLGHFAADYRNLFGETPQQTLARATGTVADSPNQRDAR